MANDNKYWSNYEQATTSFQKTLISKSISEYYLSLISTQSPSVALFFGGIIDSSSQC